MTDEFVGRFNTATANWISTFAKGLIVDPAKVFFKIGDQFGNLRCRQLRLWLEMLESPNDILSFIHQDSRNGGFSPMLLHLRVVRVLLRRHFVDVFTAVIKIEHFNSGG